MRNPNREKREKWIIGRVLGEPLPSLQLYLNLSMALNRVYHEKLKTTAMPLSDEVFDACRRAYPECEFVKHQDLCQEATNLVIEEALEQLEGAATLN